jgi:hypothetical protein
MTNFTINSSLWILAYLSSAKDVVNYFRTIQIHAFAPFIMLDR